MSIVLRQPATGELVTVEHEAAIPYFPGYERVTDPAVIELATVGYDPAGHTVDEVLDHLAGVDPAERQRIIDVELAGKNRSSLINAATLPV